MGIKNYIIDFKELGYKDSLRLWIPFVLIKSKYKYDKINNFLSTCESGRRPKGGIKDEASGGAVSLGGEQIGKNGELDLSKVPYVSLDFYNKSQKGRVKDGDILICKDGALTGKTCFVDYSMFPTDKVMVNEHVYILRGNSEINQRFLFYYTTTNIFQSQIKDLAYKKKAQPGLNANHFKKIKIPLVTKSKQDQIISKIEPIEKKIKALKSQITPPQKVINEVFSREFGFDENLFNEFGKGMTAGTQTAHDRKLKTFSINFGGIARSKILRFSTRFHNPPTIRLMDFLDSIKTLQVKDVLREPIHRGANPRYNSYGSIPVVKTGHLKNGYITISQEEFVDHDFLISTPRSQIKQGDILIASTGKGSIGKIDLMEEEKELVADSHISIMRVNERKYSLQFITYFFRSILGCFQIERDFTGATNQIELYSDEISNFKIPNISLIRQKEIFIEVKIKLDEQKEIKKEIKDKRKEIEIILENALVSL